VLMMLLQIRPMMMFLLLKMRKLLLWRKLIR